MRCEGEKTYTEPGKCPKCGMALVDTRAHKDHEARHGGVFFMAADNYHHLEATLSETGEFRIYFYDDFTKPISAEKFTAEGKAWPKGADESARKPVAIAVAPNKEYLTGRIDASIKFPASLKVYIDFKNGQKAQVFDFDFPVPSKEPKAEEHGKKTGE